jgi:coenzyme F420-dependent glucose-6-phosphate dehydrogenase
MIKLGYKASAEQFGPTELLKFGCIAEEVGFDSVFISDHFQPWRHTGGHAPFSLTWLGALGARTSRITIGTSVLTPTFRYHPSVIAQAFATLGCLCPNRIVLGIGTGESLNEVPSTGIVWPEFKERLGRLREAIELMRRLWTEERVTFAGQFYRTENATIYDRPDAPIPIFVSAAGAIVSKFVGRTADGFICTSGKTPNFYNEIVLPNLKQGLTDAGRTDDALERMIEMKVSFDTDGRRALEDTRFWAALALSADEKVSVEDPLQIEKMADALPIERIASRWIVSTDPFEQIKRIRPYIEMGFRHLVFHAPGQDQERFLRMYASQVLPLLRKEFA